MPIRDNQAEPLRASRMAAARESGQPVLTQFDTECEARSQRLQSMADWLLSSASVPLVIQFDKTRHWIGQD